MLINNDWKELEYSNGTIQNTSSYPIFITDDVNNKGLKLLQNQKYEFRNLKLLVKCDQETEITVKPFNNLPVNNSGPTIGSDEKWQELFKLDSKYLGLNIPFEDLPSAAESTIDFPVGKYINVDKSDLTEIDLPNLQKTGSYFLYFKSSKNNLQNINLPKLETVGDYCFSFYDIDVSLYELNLPNLKTTGINFFDHSGSKLKSNTQKINLPKLEKVGSHSFAFYDSISSLQEISLPSLKTVCGRFLHFYYGTYNLQEINLPNLESVDTLFLHVRECTLPIKKVILPNLKTAGTAFMNLEVNGCYSELTFVDLPNLETVGTDFFDLYAYASMPKLKYINIPKIKKIGNYFFYAKSSSAGHNYKTICTTGSVNPYNKVTFNTVIVSEYSTAISATRMFENATNVIINCNEPPPLTAGVLDNVTAIYVPVGTAEKYKETGYNYDLVEFTEFTVEKETGSVTVDGEVIC